MTATVSHEGGDVNERDHPLNLANMDNPEGSFKPALAHVRRNEDGSFEIHDLEEHVRAVASRFH